MLWKRFPEHPDKEEIERCAAIQEKYREEGGYELEARICRELYRMGLPEELLDRDFRVLSGGGEEQAAHAGPVFTPQCLCIAG